MINESRHRGRSAPRPGGRRTHNRQHILAVVRTQLEQTGCADLTVPSIAAAAGVAPSTIYRRWGDAHSLLSDAALEHLTCASIPRVTGTARDDLTTWFTQFLDALSSRTGRTALRAIMASGGRSYTNRAAYASACRTSIRLILGQTETVHDITPAVDFVVDRLVVPTIVRVLFHLDPPDCKDLALLADRALGYSAFGEMPD